MWKYNELVSLLHLVTILVALKVPSPKLLLYITYNYKFFYGQTQKFSPARTSKCQGLRWPLDSEAGTIGSRLLRGKTTGNHKVRIPQGMDPLQKRRAGLIH